MGRFLPVYLTVYAAVLCLLLWVTRWHRHWYALTKGCLSVLFVLGGLLSFYTGPQSRPWVFAVLELALVLCAVGDVMLGIANRTKTVRAKPFLGGALSFSLAHITFCVLFSIVSPPRFADALLPAGLLCVMAWLDKTGRVRLKKMRPVVYIYVALVGFMTGKALLAAATIGPATPPGLLTALGALLFLLSDVILLFLYFGTKRTRAIRYANLISYYCSILLLALSAHWI